MNIRNLIFGGLWIALITGSIGCGKIVSPVDTYGFNEAFEEKVEPLKDMVALGEDSIKLAHEVLKAVSDHDLKMALFKLETLRVQNDLSPRQRIETKSLHTAVTDYLIESNHSSSTQNAVKKVAPSVNGPV